jgi:hypothetical protein
MIEQARASWLEWEKEMKRPRAGQAAEALEIPRHHFMRTALRRMSEFVEAAEKNLSDACTQAAQYDVEEHAMEQTSKSPKLVASTSDTYCCSIADSRIRENKLQDVPSQEQDAVPLPSMKDEELELNYFKNAQWYVPFPMVFNPSNHAPGLQMEPASSPRLQTTQSGLSSSLQHSLNRPPQ